MYLDVYVTRVFVIKEIDDRANNWKRQRGTFRNVSDSSPMGRFIDECLAKKAVTLSRRFAAYRRNHIYEYVYGGPKILGRHFRFRYDVIADILAYR